MVDSQGGAKHRVGYNNLISNKREWNTLIVLLKTPKELQYLSSTAIFIDLYQLPNLWSMVYELIYYSLLTNQNTGIAIYYCFIRRDYKDASSGLASGPKHAGQKQDY